MKILTKKEINQSLDDFYSFADFEKRRNALYTKDNFNLLGIKNLLLKLNNPQKSYKIIHIAGTKGKGSTAFFLTQLLEKSFPYVGLYTSPHLVDERDRISVNQKNISWEDFFRLFYKIQKIIKKDKLKITVFDIYTSIAFCYFKEKKVKIAVIETGLGGRLDSTNIVHPIASVITPIHLDHTQRLGKTLQKIAIEKAGIIKKQIPVFTASQKVPVRKILKNVSLSLKSPLYFNSNKLPKKYNDLEFPFFQKENLRLAIKTLKKLNLFPKEFIKIKLLNGRYMKKGKYLLDAAHNPLAIKTLIKSIKNDVSLKGKKIKVVFFCQNDKDILKMLKLFPLNWEIYIFDLKVNYIKKQFPWKNFLKENRLNYPVITKKNKITSQLKENEICVVTGSFLLIKKFL